MATDSTSLVVPFAGERFAALDALDGLISPPYDVISPERRKALAANPHNIVHVVLPEGSGDRYDAAARRWDEWKNAGAVVRETEPAVWVVRQTFTTPVGATFSRTGLLGAIAVEDYDGGRVKPHERTHKGPKEDRLALTRATDRMFEALLMMAPDRNRQLVAALHGLATDPPMARATLDNVAIEIWRVTGAHSTRLTQMASADALYIADGHHRYETAIAYRQENPAAQRTLGLIVPLGDPGLVVLPTHRVLHGDTPEADAVVRRLADVFETFEMEASADVERWLSDARAGHTRAVVAVGGHTIGLVLSDDAKLAALPEEPTVRRLDVARVDTLIVDPLKQLMGNGATVTYSPDTNEVRTLAANGNTIGVMLNPTRVEEVLAVSDAGAFMPQKSTYFMPKVPSGLVAMRVIME